MTLKSWIERALTDRLQPEALIVEDESLRHKGHANYREGHQTHFHVSITAATFTGKSRIERHRLVNDILSPAFDMGLHALRLDTKAPGE